MKLPNGNFLIALITSGTLLYVGIVFVTRYADISSILPKSLNCFTRLAFWFTSVVSKIFLFKAANSSAFLDSFPTALYQSAIFSL